MGVLEGKVDTLIVTCTSIDTKMGDIANKSYVLYIFGVTAVVLILSLVGHVLVRSLSGS